MITSLEERARVITRDLLEQVEAVGAQPDLHTLEPGRAGRVGEVATHHLAVRGQDACGSHPRAREPHHQVGPGRQRRARLHVIDCWYSVKPIAAHTDATIQKRRMILVSDHASSSK